MPQLCEQRMITEPHKSSFQTIVLDDPSFPDLILKPIKLHRQAIRRNTINAITNIIFHYPSMKTKFIMENMVGRMFETVDFVSLPLSESKTFLHLTTFIACMCEPIGDSEEARFKRYPLIRVSVFEPAKQFLTFIFHNSDKLILDESHKNELTSRLCLVHNHIKNMELRSDEHDADFVSELVKWETRTMVEMENEDNFRIVFRSFGNRTQEWNRDKREREKRRAVLLREDGWDDAIELRVVGIEADVSQKLHQNTLEITCYQKVKVPK
ncbi:hypothetical protein BLNAU_9743 [Blattamonas nauphoetae]|uniref:Uncharacterized protein n=1 Tax=Blattamonas nauphoetae TaxID=2049346 RepID=A0ABQ9XV44_9EUKA|nr:hypothetical protein BLNAU_9743 [Blattamonas nauphoetae]